MTSWLDSGFQPWSVGQRGCELLSCGCNAEFSHLWGESPKMLCFCAQCSGKEQSLLDWVPDITLVVCSLGCSSCSQPPIRCPPLLKSQLECLSVVSSHLRGEFQEMLHLCCCRNLALVERMPPDELKAAWEERQISVWHIAPPPSSK